jgi:hypothetical protein
MSANRGRCGVVSVTTGPLGTIFINFGGEYPQPEVRRIHCSRVSDSSRSATYHDPRENHQLVTVDQIKGLNSQTER